MALFTFVLDYCGGTYLSQVESEDFTAAPRRWANELNFGKGAQSVKTQLMPLIDLETPVPVEGLVNTWCLTFTVQNKLAIVHYCQTVEED